MNRPVLVIHGGTGSRPDRSRLARLRRALQAICARGYEHLRSHSALESVVLSVQWLEDDPLFNAGTGSVLQEDGKARMSASLMDGERLRFSAVLNIEQVRYPILVAQTLFFEENRVLAGSEATQFARMRGFERWDPITTQQLRRWQQEQHRKISTATLKRNAHSFQGTVGAVALDCEGKLAAATSTGGRPFARAGRVSDSGMPAGNYANHEVALSCTGYGEDIIDEAMASRIAQRVLDGLTLGRAFTLTFRELKARKRLAGAIALTRKGRWAWATTFPVVFAVAETASGQSVCF